MYRLRGPNGTRVTVEFWGPYMADKDALVSCELMRGVLQCVAVCCSGCCSVLQGPTWLIKMLVFAASSCAVCCSVLQCVAGCCRVLRARVWLIKTLVFASSSCSVYCSVCCSLCCSGCGSMLQCVAVYCTVCCSIMLHGCWRRSYSPQTHARCVAVRCSVMQRVLQCVAVCSYMADKVALISGTLAFLDRYDRSFSVL